MKIFDGETRTPEFLNINKFSTIPALAHGSLKIGASDSILQYLCEVFPEKLKCYYGLNPAERVQINEFLSWYQSTYRPALIAMIIPKFSYSRQQKTIPKSVHEEARVKMEDALSKFNVFLSKGNTYICGEKVTIADLLYFFDTANVFFIYKGNLDKWEKVNNWFNKMMEISEIAKIQEQYKE